MIKVKNIHKRYRTRFGWKRIFSGLSFNLRDDESLGILGRNGAGKSTLMRILAGLEKPDRGKVEAKNIRVSWPLGAATGVHGSLTGRDNVKFVCRLYDEDYKEKLAFIEDFAELGTYMDMPVKTYSVGMKQRLTFGISMAFDFDTYLIDEGFGGGDARFKNKVTDIFDKKIEKNKTNMIVVSHNENNIRRFCNKAAVLNDGELIIYEDMEEAISIYQNL